MTQPEVQDVLCECDDPLRIHEDFKGKKVCTREGCRCGNFVPKKEANSAPASGSGNSDWFADIVEAGIDGIAKHLVNKAKGRIR
jgi:hypothetical protein